MTGSQGEFQVLQGLVEKYEILGSRSKRAWDRLKWSSNAIGELRARLTLTTVLRTAFFGVLIFHTDLHYGVNPSVLAPLKLWLNESSTGGSRENQSSHSLLSSLQLLMTSKCGESYEKSSKWNLSRSLQQNRKVRLSHVGFPSRQPMPTRIPSNISRFVAPQYLGTFKNRQASPLLRIVSISL